MGVRSNNRVVDFDRLDAEFRKRGLRTGEVASQLGRTPGYFANMRKKGHLPEATLIMLDALLNIKREDIEPIAEAEQPTVAEQPEEAESKEPTIVLTKEELRYIITESIKDAFTWYANL